jgi:hypothetical protein
LETEPFWKAFLRSLADRGLRGLKLVVADDHKGLRAAAAKVFSATHHRCRVHWLRNALAHVPPKQRPAAVAMLKTIFAQDTAEAAHAQWRQVADALRERFPKLGELMDGARDDVLAYMTFPREHYPQIASTNPLERLNGEIKRRADVIGIFPNDRSVVRLVGALMLEQCDVYGPPPPCNGFLNDFSEASACCRVSGLAARHSGPQALMVFADRLPDKWTNSKVRIASWACADPGQTGSPSSFSHPRKPDARRLGASGSFRRHAPHASDRFRHGQASPRRPELSCAPTLSPRPARDASPEAARAKAAASDWDV